jgi:hypothetical protein
MDILLAIGVGVLLYVAISAGVGGRRRPSDWRNL